MAQNVIVLEKDPRLVRSLVGGLYPHFSVDVTDSHEELRDKVEQTKPEAVVLNIEYWRLTAMEAGASDVCPSDDVGNVLTSVLRSTALSRSAAA